METPKQILVPFSWVDDRDTGGRHLSNADLSMYRDVVTGCRIVADLLVYDDLARRAADDETILDEHDCMSMNMFLRSTLLLLERHMTDETENIIMPKS